MSLTEWRQVYNPKLVKECTFVFSGVRIVDGNTFPEWAWVKTNYSGDVRITVTHLLESKLMEHVKTAIPDTPYSVERNTPPRPKCLIM